MDDWFQAFSQTLAWMPLYHFWSLQYLIMPWVGFLCLRIIKAWRSVLDDWTQQSQWWAVSLDDKWRNWPSLARTLWTAAAAWSFQRFRWKQDGAPAHRRVIAEERLRLLFNHRVIALNYDPEWPPRSPDLTPCERSPDLTPCDFFFVFGGISRAKCSRHSLETV